MPIKIISESIYRTKINFIFKENKKNVLKYLKNKTSKDLKYLEDLYDRSNAFFMWEGGRDYFLIISVDKDKDKTWESLLAHEALHIVCTALREKGVILSSESEEAYTYYLTFIVDACSKLYKSKK